MAPKRRRRAAAPPLASAAPSNAVVTRGAAIGGRRAAAKAKSKPEKASLTCKPLAISGSQDDRKATSEPFPLAEIPPRRTAAVKGALRPSAAQARADLKHAHDAK